MLKADKESLAIMKLCPRFSHCSAPICPLDPLQDERDCIKGEPKCKLAKNRRFKIGQNSLLPYKGLTKMEWAARQRWDNLTASQKAEKRAELRKNSPFIRGNSNRQFMAKDYYQNP